MNGGRLSAAEKGKQKAADDDADLPPAALVLKSAGEPRPAAGAASAAGNWHGGGSGSGSGLPRHLLLVPPSGTSEIEEAPPSPPPPAPSRLVPAALPALAGLQGRLKEMQAALDSRLRELEQLQRERETAGGSQGAAELAGGAEAQVLQRLMGAVQAKVSGMKDMMLALRFQAEEMQALEEFWKPVVPLPDHQRNNNSNRKAEQMRALEEFWKPVPVPQRKNSKINWNQIISWIALTGWLVPCIISVWILLPPVNNLIHIAGAISVLWILGSTHSCFQRFRTSRTISRHVPRLIYVCYCLLLLYVLYLILRLIHGAFAGLLGKHQ